MSNTKAAITYRLIYDAGAAGFHTRRWTMIGLIFVAIGVIGTSMIWRVRTPRARVFGRSFALAWTLGSASLTAALHHAIRTQHRMLVDALATHRYQLVEGVVDDYTPEGVGGHPVESWSVTGHHYMLSSNVVSSGFSEVGRVRLGQQVRIADVNGTIARIEVAP
jgi:hypothetical protein